MQEPSVDIDLLPGIGHKVRWHMRQVGIHTAADIQARSIEELDAIPGIGRILAYRLKSYARAFLENQAIWLTVLPALCQQPGIMFDLETEPNTMAPWSLGWCTLDGRAWTAIVAPDHTPGELELPDGTAVEIVRSQEDAWAVFEAGSRTEVDPGCQPPIYHWTGYDSAIMRRFAPDDVKANLHTRMHDLHATFKRTVILPQRSTSLKPVAHHLGFIWPEGAADGQGWWLAWQDYQRWLSVGDLDALARACRYQRADVQAMIVVWSWLNEHAKTADPRPHKEGGA